ncbi:MAG: hypothetical protein WBD40_23680 [Tepidisphaeraceae bacterium]
MRLSTFHAAAAAAMIGSSLLGGCASKAKETFPATPVAVPLSEMQAMRLADAYLADRQAPAPRHISLVEPTGDGNLVAVHTAFSVARPPVASRLLEVKHDGSVRELTFQKVTE